jgi:hypothetical protein
MATRLRPLKLGEAPDPAVNGIIQFSKDGFGDTAMFGLIARRPELLKRIASVFEYLGNHFNITMRVDTEPESAYPHDLAYAEVRPSGRSR